MDQGSKNHLCNLEGGLQRAGRARALWGETPLFSTPSSVLRASGSCNRFARNAGEGGRQNTQFRGEVVQKGPGSNNPLSQIRQREWTPKAKGS